jgi:WD40 repeat protein
MILSSGGKHRDLNGGSINPFISGHTNSVYTLIVKGCGEHLAFEGDNGMTRLRKFIQPFKNIRRLILLELKCNDTLSGLSLSLLETLEV